MDDRIPEFYDGREKKYIQKEICEEGDVQMFIGKIRHYAAITELDETVLNRLIMK